MRPFWTNCGELTVAEPTLQEKSRPRKRPLVSTVQTLNIVQAIVGLAGRIDLVEQFPRLALIDL
jgi:hypothetical protein